MIIRTARVLFARALVCYCFIDVAAPFVESMSKCYLSIQDNRFYKQLNNMDAKGMTIYTTQVG